ncbi:MAG: 16S rRNA (guanine(527)-N(7))-methyltransferase RsmG [Firmicutes bacterium]|nr:16S rRNA (guanine(527)-N(7))-methyltransferase RsmG [Bacillota bacterium]
MEELERLREGAAALGVELGAPEAERLLRVLDEVLEANRRVNLTAVRERAAALEKHLLDSVAAWRVWRPRGDERVVDVGTGGGLPGLALKAVAPGLRLVLLDAARRKIDACRDIVQRLGWDGVAAVHGRAEEWARGDGRESQDAAVVRAVGALDVVAELTLPCVRPGGVVLAWKGRLDGEELEAGRRAARVLGGEIATVDRFALPWSGAARAVVLIEKARPTPPRYPRRPGIPERRPLGGGRGKERRDADGSDRLADTDSGG